MESHGCHQPGGDSVAVGREPRRRMRRRRGRGPHVRAAAWRRVSALHPWVLMTPVGPIPFRAFAGPVALDVRLSSLRLRQHPPVLEPDPGRPETPEHIWRRGTCIPISAESCTAPARTRSVSNASTSFSRWLSMELVGSAFRARGGSTSIDRPRRQCAFGPSHKQRTSGVTSPGRDPRLIHDRQPDA